MKFLKILPNILSITRLVMSSSLFIVWVVVAAIHGFATVNEYWVMSTLFLTIYIIAGITDMIDGAIARKLGVASPFGANLDGIADYTFVGLSIIMLIPYFLYVGLSLFIIISVVAGIVILKGVGMVVGYMRYGQLMMMHTYAAKIAALSAFLAPLIYYIAGSQWVNVIFATLGIWVYIYLIEEIVINMITPEPNRDITGIRKALRLRREHKSLSMGNE